MAPLSSYLPPPRGEHEGRRRAMATLVVEA
jgi:hypothetical protein